MIGKMLRRGARPMSAGNENAPEAKTNEEGTVPVSKVRALATGAALATSIDNSPAVLVSIYDYAHNYGGSKRRRAS
ncbi:MAG: hypothetical protein F9K29_16340 [Hyphomicrobiaceae bacterium]|nr:MAG: hypothetical protein F9K29_16340 [Hyphomicrobiaceae bacterium]